MFNWILLHEFVFCRIIELNKWICAKKIANGLYFYNGDDVVKEGHPIKFKSNWGKESKRICTKCESNSD